MIYLIFSGLSVYMMWMVTAWWIPGRLSKFRPTSSPSYSPAVIARPPEAVRGQYQTFLTWTAMDSLCESARQLYIDAINATDLK